MKTLTRIGIVAGEPSGDILGAGLISQLKKSFPECEFVGVGGELMIAEGFKSYYPLDRLAVMGLVEPLKRLPELLSMRASLKKRFTEQVPDVFIGIDSPDFNLNLELHLRNAGIKTVHYVSPSVWAWRQGRVKGIAKAVDLMLTLFDFEAAFYHQHDVKALCIGHKLADEIPLEDTKKDARQALNLDVNKPYVALLPGSRRSEVEQLCEIFLIAARQCLAQNKHLEFLIPAVNVQRHAEIREIVAAFPDVPVTLSTGNSRQVMAAADAVMMASGTTTLEALLLKRPMVIAYRAPPLTYWLISPFVKTKFVGLPNLLAGKEIVPELIQANATPEKLSASLMEMLTNTDKQKQLNTIYTEIHVSLRKNADQAAADAIIRLVREQL